MQEGQKRGPYFGTVFGRKHMTEAELEKIVAAAAGNRWSTRDQTMLRFCFRHGLRACELVALRWTDIVWEDHAVIIHRRKQRTRTGTRPNIHPLAPDEIKALKALYAEYGAETDHVFAAERRGPDGRFTAMTTSGFSKLLRRLETKAGVPNFGPHALRHGRAQSLANAGRDAFLIRDALGHGTIASANTYVAANPERLRGVL